MVSITYNVINTYFDECVDNGFKEFSYVREKRYWPIFRNSRRVIRFKDRGNKSGFPNNKKNSFFQGT